MKLAHELKGKFGLARRVIFIPMRLFDQYNAYTQQDVHIR